MRVALGSYPTPLEPAPRLAQALGLNPGDLWIKRDDLIGLGGGGNKARKLEYTAGAAVAAGAGTLITTGAPQSNHARLTAAAGARLGMEVVLVLAGEPGESHSGNLALDGLLGARVVWGGDVHEVAAEYANAAVIPFGGSSKLGAQGYVEAGRELLEQAPDVRNVVVAVGSGGTMAGLIGALGSERVLGVHTGAVDDPAAAVTAIEPCEPRIRLDQVGAGYEHLTDAVHEALLLAARTEGIVLDPIYTGRALAGLKAAVADGQIAPGTKTVFLHSGGLPGFFGHAETVRRAESLLG